jgi:hypothetical protein
MRVDRKYSLFEKSKILIGGKLLRIQKLNYIKIKGKKGVENDWN